MFGAPEDGAMFAEVPIEKPLPSGIPRIVMVLLDERQVESSYLDER